MFSVSRTGVSIPDNRKYGKPVCIDAQGVAFPSASN
jgi:hypothetical protein